MDMLSFNAKKAPTRTVNPIKNKPGNNAVTQGSGFRDIEYAMKGGYTGRMKKIQETGSRE
jgi:hypothetical protein